jgi:hypothetical protein
MMSGIFLCTVSYHMSLLLKILAFTNELDFIRFHVYLEQKNEINLSFLSLLVMTEYTKWWQYQRNM